MDKLIEEIKELIISSLDLEDISSDEIDENDALFVEGLGLDSIDALELGMAVQKKYGAKIDAQDPDVKSYFSSVKNLAEFISKNRKD
ncbi:phosphopantetheine-binding protein [Curvivirga aplysinae]|uniref:phosphopantetheine-binding protein n=1 Tax=Curvivirga aplysinae TaxID=2529852 RepID=UPI0012BBA289|nr:phosphopantetheine-binding protein [Curvivirga aplysinae]MTI11034.1 acyl carrier protein [Curvivirga aplysinae]